MISNPTAGDLLRAAVHMHAIAGPDEGLPVWIADLVGDLFDICLERDETFTIARFREAVGRGVDYAEDDRPGAPQ